MDQEIELWKIQHPIFLFKERDFTKISKINSGQIEANEELTLLQFCMRDFSVLLSDPQVSHHDIFIALISNLITKRIKELQDKLANDYNKETQS